jgi:hypothetical protein
MRPTIDMIAAVLRIDTVAFLLSGVAIVVIRVDLHKTEGDPRRVAAPRGPQSVLGGLV